MMRIGKSTDIHRLKKGDTLVLGGIEIPSTVEAIGHSDADCLLHAIAEALLGSLALGDLGRYYPDTDSAYSGYDSKIILKDCYERVKELGYRIVNIDTMICLETPKLTSYIKSIQEKIAQVLNIEPESISIKATTAEKLGVIGNNEAIACEAVVLVAHQSEIKGKE